MTTTLIKNGLIVEGTDSDAYEGDILIENDRIKTLAPSESDEEKIRAGMSVDLVPGPDLPLEQENLIEMAINASIAYAKRPAIPGGYINVVNNKRRYLTCGNCQIVC